MNTQFYRQWVQQHGVGASLYYAAARAAKRVASFEVWNGIVITLDRLDQRFLSDPKVASFKDLDAESMRPYVGTQDVEGYLTHSNLDEAAARGDRCFVAFDGDELMSFGWYSTKPVPLGDFQGELVLQFDPSYAYMYNGLTRPKYRGQRLHAVGMAVALQRFTQAGLKGLVSYVENANAASLKSCDRMGYSTFGYVAVARFGGRYLCTATQGCKQYGFRVDPRPVA